MKRVSRNNLVDLSLLLSIPTTLLLIHALVSKPVAEGFYFYPMDPSVLNAWTAALLHDSWRHVGGNSIAYLFTMLMAYLIYDEWDRARTMWLVVLGVVVTTPIVTSSSNILVFQQLVEGASADLNVKGFSGVSSAILGMLWATIALYTNQETDSNMGWWVVFIGYLAVALYLLAVYQTSILSSPMGLLVILFGLGFAVYRINNKYLIKGYLSKEGMQRVIHNSPAVVVVGGMLIGILMFVGYFPASITSGSTTTNIISHIIGLVWGFVITLGIMRGMQITAIDVGQVKGKLAFDN